jgi:hypothetical protein
MKVSDTSLRRLKQTLTGLQTSRLPYWQDWRQLADYYLPRRYVGLLSSNERRRNTGLRNPLIVDGTGTVCAKILAAGMNNGITSPARPWLRLGVTGVPEEGNNPSRVWLDDVGRILLSVMAQSNFYNGIAIVYLDLAVFGTSAMLIYEDYENVICVYNPPLGEYYLALGPTNTPDTFAREFVWTVKQCVVEFGLENCSDRVKDAWKSAGARLFDPVQVSHLIEPNYEDDDRLPSMFKVREWYWEAAATGPENSILAKRGFREQPGIYPRYDVSGNDAYGVGPGWDALGDVIQLQQESVKKAKALDKLISPPIIADISLQNSPIQLLPNGVTFATRINEGGAKPIYTVNPPLGEMTADIRDIRTRISETFHNPLFNMISQLDTVRTATEIDARREEKLVLLGPVLERFGKEALDQAVKRVYAICQRKGLLPDPPEEIADAEIEIQYISILTTAQRAVATAPIERWMQFVGNLAPAKPEVLNVVNFEETVRYYGQEIGVPARLIQPKETVEAAAAAQQQQEALASGLGAASVGADIGKNLSETDVGGGANALQVLLSG